MNVKEAAILISDKIGKQYPSEQDSIFSILDLIQEEIWQAGLFHGSTKWTYVNARDDGTIITPHGYNILLGLNIDFKPKTIRDNFFLFHQNGPADAPLTNNFTNNVIDLGQFPIFKNIERICNPCSGQSCKTFLIGAKLVGECKEFPTTRIIGRDKQGRQIFSYQNKDNEECFCQEDEIEYYDAIPAIQLKLNNSQIKISRAEFSSIDSIYKEPTLSPVEYYMFEGGSTKGELIARLDPFQIKSEYRIYKIPNSCVKNRCVFGLFKRSKPDKIISEQQEFIVDNRNAIISIAMGLDYKYNKGLLEKGIQFIASGIGSLSNEVKEQESNNVKPLQYSGPFVNSSPFD